MLHDNIANYYKDHGILRSLVNFFDKLYNVYISKYLVFAQISIQSHRI